MSEAAYPSVDSVDVWLVEDHDVFRETIGDLVDGAPGLQCSHRFISCEDALAAFDAGVLPDLVLMDIGLPGIDGIEGARRVKTRFPALPIIILTVHRDNDKIFKAICAGASGYLLKTSPPSAIIEAIYQVRRGGAPIDAQIARRVLDMFTHLALPQADYGLSDRERSILQYLVDGLTKKQIAAQIHLSYHTIDGYIRNIYAKLEVHTRAGAVAKALREKLV